ncbi:MAG: radical SAM protein [Deltaproteobacteria bacterium]|nr:radical SAM protein [Deltaproteobacteria bacterium]
MNGPPDAGNTDNNENYVLDAWIQGLGEKARARITTLVSGLVSRLGAPGPDEATGRENAAGLDDKVRALLGGLVKNLEDNPSAGKWLARLLEQLGDGPLEKMVENFFFNVTYESFAIRRDYQARNGLLPPITVVINPTMRCNLKCSGCYAWNFSKKDMDYSLLKQLLEELRDLGVRFITVSGGEPLLYPYLDDMLQDFNDMIFMSYSNGILIDDKMADKIAGYGNFWPALSVEGYEEETDKRRGPGVYKKVLEAMDRLRKRGVMFGFSATPVRNNSDILATDEFVDSMIEQGCLFGWFFNYIPVGRSPDIELMPTPEQRDKLRQMSRRWISGKPIFLGDFWNDGPAAGGCLSASRYAYITVEGNVQPCTFVHFYTHNLRNSSFEEIWNSPFFEAIRQKQPYDDNLLRPCKIIDRPEVLKEVVEETGAMPSYPGADNILSDKKLRDFLKDYSERYGALADPAWEGPDYEEGKSVLVPFLGRINIWDFYGKRLHPRRPEKLQKADSQVRDAP